MSVPNQPMYRANALRHYMHGQGKSTYLRFAPLPLTLLLWILLGLLLIMGIMTWNEEVPSYLHAPGFILAATSSDRTQAKEQDAGNTAILFLSPDQRASLQHGMPVRLYVGTSDRYLDGKITAIASETVSPRDIQKRYTFEDCSVLVAHPVTEVTVTLKEPAPNYVGSQLNSRITVGSRRLLALLPGIGHFFTK